MKTDLVRIGVMQGRLSPPRGGRIQSFPVDTWREEFKLVRQAGLDCIEWIYEKEAEEVNPLTTDEGIAEIRLLAENSGVAVGSVCGDYYMKERLVTGAGKVQEKVVEHLRWLLGRIRLLGGHYIVLPFVDASSLDSSREIKGLVKVMESVISTAEHAGIELHLETDLMPTRLAALLERISHPLVRANYDTGNSAALGQDPVEELTLLGPWLGSVHVKDRVLGGGTVPLGTGTTDFPTCFRLIRAADFRGPFILQAAREEGLNEVELAARNRLFVKEQLLSSVGTH
ncbi:sugar phosphate isomerase/epimerase [Acidobacteria bacterium AH-259-A15]|nr:sugar phosphate isomerase/epimerase [Acidobacteria bacterium AH-259-A15]